jgi:hypothetical protein
MAVTSVRAGITASRLGYVPMLVMMALVFGAGCCLFGGHAADDDGHREYVRRLWRGLNPPSVSDGHLRIVIWGRRSI